LDGSAIGEKVYWHRDARGWTQEELAKESGVSATTISHIESGAIERPRMNTVRRLARAFGTSTEAFLRSAELATPLA
jgi:transcriptional regulator with XRE-family HTH domain